MLKFNISGKRIKFVTFQNYPPPPSICRWFESGRKVDPPLSASFINSIFFRLEQLLIFFLLFRFRLIFSNEDCVAAGFIAGDVIGRFPADAQRKAGT